MVTGTKSFSAPGREDVVLPGCPGALLGAFPVPTRKPLSNSFSWAAEPGLLSRATC